MIGSKWLVGSSSIRKFDPDNDNLANATRLRSPLDTACVDLVYAMKKEENHALVERIESRHGLRQLSYMHELNMGNTKYKLIDIDNNDKEITREDAV